MRVTDEHGLAIIPCHINQRPGSFAWSLLLLVTFGYHEANGFEHEE